MVNTSWKRNAGQDAGSLRDTAGGSCDGVLASGCIASVWSLQVRAMQLSNHLSSPAQSRSSLSSPPTASQLSPPLPPLPSLLSLHSLHHPLVSCENLTAGIYPGSVQIPELHPVPSPSTSSAACSSGSAVAAAASAVSSSHHLASGMLLLLLLLLLVLQQSPSAPQRPSAGLLCASSQAQMRPAVP